MPNTNEADTLKNIAAQGGSTKNILKNLTRKFYKIDDTLPQSIVNDIVIAEFKAAHSQAKLNQHIDTTKMSQSADSVTATLTKMKGLKDTFALYEQYAQSFNTMINESRELMLEKENLDVGLKNHIEGLHTQLTDVLKEIRAGKSKDQIKNILTILNSQEKALKPKIDKLEEKVKLTLYELVRDHQIIYSNLPLEVRTGVNEPLKLPPAKNTNPAPI